MSELKPCPFCGGTAKLVSREDRVTNKREWYVQCTKCGAKGSERREVDVMSVDGGEFIFKTEVEMITDAWESASKAWNRRSK